jgi:hypothetical protein
MACDGALMHEQLHVRRWFDPVVEAVGHDARGWYVEAFWLPVIGPTAIALARRLADGLDRHPEGFTVQFVELSASLGLGDKPPSNRAMLTRALRRLDSFKFIALDNDNDDDGAGAGDSTNDGDRIRARTHLPPIHSKHLRRLPDVVRSAHHEWAEAQLTRPLDDLARMRARRLALCLLEEGDDTDCAERALARMGVPTRLARDAATWARDRHVQAARAAQAAAELTPSA